MSPPDLTKKTWLADLVETELAHYDPVAAGLRLPPEVRAADSDGLDLEARARILVLRSLRKRRVDEQDEAAEFLAPIQGHLSLALDLALIASPVFERDRRRAELAAFFAATVGESSLALAADPNHDGGGAAPAVRRAYVRTGALLHRRCFPPGDPVLGIPLYAGVVAIQRRHLARVVMAYFRKGRLEIDSMERHLDYARQELVLLAEALAGLPTGADPHHPERRRILARQIARIGLPRDLEVAGREAVSCPRPPREIARAAPARMRTFLVEQLLVAELAKGHREPAAVEYIGEFAAMAQIGPERLQAMQVEAAAFHADHRVWFEAVGSSGMPKEWEALGLEWEAIGDQIVQRVAAAITENLEAVVTEIKETGELGQLLAKAAAGKPLNADEKRKVKAQLIDLAKAVPALAIFAAPGGMLLLPILAKLLPFNVLPSAWDKRPKEPPAVP